MNSSAVKAPASPEPVVNGLLLYSGDHPTQEQLAASRDIARRSLLVIRSRWLLILLIGIYGLLSTGLYAAGGFRDLLAQNLLVPAAAVAFTVAYNAWFHYSYEWFSRLRYLNHAQLLFDLAVVTVLIHFSGGVVSWFWAVYMLITLEAAVLLERKLDAWLIGAAGALMHGSLLIAEFGGALPRVAMPFIDARLQHTFTYEALAWAWVAAMNVAVAAIGGYLMSVVREREAALSEMVVTDSETGLRNRKYFFHRLGGEVARCRQFGRLVSVLVIDIDRFKNYNDLHGHAAGDRLLQSLAGILTTAVHRHETAAADSDVEVVCRTSSGEFAIILPEAATAEGKSVAERVRQHAQEMLATQSAEKIRSRVSRYVTDRQGITLSVGVATYTTDVRNADELVVRARAALAKAKASGGDKVGAWVDELELIA